VKGNFRARFLGGRGRVNRPRLPVWCHLIMKKTCSLIVVTMLAFCGCSTHREPTLAENLNSKSSAASMTAEAGKFLRDLHERGKLPGLSKDDHGELKAKVSDFSETVHFPLSLTFQFAKNRDSIYNYTVQRLSETSDWRVIKAWQADAAGKPVKEFPTQ
jgi:hypothetical protein